MAIDGERATSGLAEDTAPEVARVQIELLRRAGFARRAALTGSLSHTVVQLSRRALRDRMPGASEREVLLRWVALHYGDDLACRVARRLEP
jgi:hypothetical protein